MQASPARFISQYGPELGQAIIDKNIKAVSAASICVGRWIGLVEETIFPCPVNGIVIPATFQNHYIANEWLLVNLPSLDLLQPECLEKSDNRIAYRVFSALTQEYVVAEVVKITDENAPKLREKYTQAALTLPQPEQQT